MLLEILLRAEFETTGLASPFANLKMHCGDVSDEVELSCEDFVALRYLAWETVIFHFKLLAIHWSQYCSQS